MQPEDIDSEEFEPRCAMQLEELAVELPIEQKDRRAIPRHPVEEPAAIVALNQKHWLPLYRARPEFVRLPPAHRVALSRRRLGPR